MNKILIATFILSLFHLHKQIATPLEISKAGQDLKEKIIKAAENSTYSASEMSLESANDIFKLKI